MNQNLQSCSTAANATATIPFKAIIFDMDGTLLQSTEADYRAWEKVFNRYDRKLSFEDYVPLLRIKSADVIKEELLVEDEDLIKKILQEKLDCFVEYINENPIKPVPAAEDFLKSLAEYPVRVALATSSRKEKMQLVLKRLNFLQYFDTVVTGNEVLNSKPAPDIFLLAAKKLGLPPGECIVVEDAPVGVAAAKSAHMKCIAISETHSADQLATADLIIDTYYNADFKEMCDRIASGQASI